MTRYCFKKENVKPEYFSCSYSRGYLKGNVWREGGRGVVNMWGRDVTLWLAGADLEQLEHVCRAEL